MYKSENRPQELHYLGGKHSLIKRSESAKSCACALVFQPCLFPVSCFQLRIHTGQRWHIRVTLYAFYINAHSKLSNQRIGNLARIWSSVHFKMASQRGKMFRSKLPSEPHNVDSTDSEESEELDSTVSTLSVDEDGPNETQPETATIRVKWQGEKTADWLLIRWLGACSNAFR